MLHTLYEYYYTDILFIYDQIPPQRDENNMLHKYIDEILV